MEHRKTILSSLILGFKKGWDTPSLPDNIIKLQSHILIRVLRFLGGISLILTLAHSYINLPLSVRCILIFILLLFHIYLGIISFIRIKHIIKLIKSGALNVRNS